MHENEAVSRPRVAPTTISDLGQFDSSCRADLDATSHQNSVRPLLLPLLPVLQSLHHRLRLLFLIPNRSRDLKRARRASVQDPTKARDIAHLALVDLERRRVDEVLTGVEHVDPTKDDGRGDLACVRDDVVVVHFLVLGSSEEGIQGRGEGGTERTEGTLHGEGALAYAGRFDGLAREWGET